MANSRLPGAYIRIRRVGELTKLTSGRSQKQLLTIRQNEIPRPRTRIGWAPRSGTDRGARPHPAPPPRVPGWPSGGLLCTEHARAHVPLKRLFSVKWPKNRSPCLTAAFLPAAERGVRGIGGGDEPARPARRQPLQIAFGITFCREISPQTGVSAVF